MYTVKIKTIVNVAASAANSSLAHPQAELGYKGNVRTVEITDIPDDVENWAVLKAWNETTDISYLGRADCSHSRHMYRFDEIGGGRILRV